ncbi:MAG TPA: hypothetical protein DCS19_02065 [Flavobacterium sp.]|nr:hypothetical protein [Flavobacterium sp.]
MKTKSIIKSIEIYHAGNTEGIVYEINEAIELNGDEVMVTEIEFTLNPPEFRLFTNDFGEENEPAKLIKRVFPSSFEINYEVVEDEN